VARDDAGAITSTGVRRVDGTDRLQELSRMLAGLPDSDLARGHAEELLAVAAAAKQDP
jgi:DNA repair protein RecN (Recombination protein N)